MEIWHSTNSSTPIRRSLARKCGNLNIDKAAPADSVTRSRAKFELDVLMQLKGFLLCRWQRSLRPNSAEIKMGSPTAITDMTYTRITAIILSFLLIVRTISLILTPLNLGPDEAQYWRWGQSLDWGYFSKPPLIAWTIWLTTGLFGDSEWATRLAAPFLHTAAATTLFVLGRSMFSSRVGMLASFTYILMPGVVLSSVIISTDGILMPFWSLALLSVWRLREGGTWRSAVLFGLSLGLGFLAKYAMIYFCIGIVLIILFDPHSRRALLSRNGILATLITATIIAPHFIWNAANDFKTISHTVDNANLGGSLFHPENALTFLADQMGVFGPVSFLALIGSLILLRNSGADFERARDRWLMCFILPVLGIILVQAVISRAHANWAAAAYPAASILVAASLTRAKASALLWYATALTCFLVAFLIPDMSLKGSLLIGSFLVAVILLASLVFKYRPSGLLWAGLATQAILSLAFTFLAIGPVSWSETLGVANAFKRTRGWEATTEAVINQAATINATAILVDERENWHGLDYYGRDTLPIPIYGWRRGTGASSYSEERTLTAPDDTIVLVASVRTDFRPRIRADFTTFNAIGEINIPLGGRKYRRMKLYEASGFQPLPRGPDWESQFEGLSEN